MMATAYKKGQASILLLLHLAYISIKFQCVIVLCTHIPQHGCVSEFKTPRTTMEIMSNTMGS